VSSKRVEQFPVARVSPDHVRVIRLKKILQRELAFFRRQIICRLSGDSETDIALFPHRVLNLRHQ